MSYAPSSGNVPILVLKEETRRERGRKAIERNITAAKSIADIVRTTFGPKGMNKLVVDSLGDLIITNDGATILDELDIQHPAAKLIVQAAKSQDNEAGDGTTTVAVLAGELLDKAKTLLDKGIHQTIIVSTYRKMLEKSREFLEDLALDVSIDEEEKVTNIAKSALNSKLPKEAREHFSKIVYEAAKRAYDPERNYLDLDLVSIIQKEGKSLMDSELAKGVVIDKKIVHSGMPTSKENPKVALIDQNIEVEKGEVATDVTLDTIGALEKLQEREKKEINKMVGKLRDFGVDVLFCQRGISDRAQDILAKDGVLAVRRAKKSDIRLLSKITGAKIVSNLEDLKESDIGNADRIEQRKVGGDKLVFVETEKEGAGTVLIRGATNHVTDEAERAFHDAISVSKDVIEDKKMVPAIVEASLAHYLEKWMGKAELSGKEIKVANTFIDALYAIPKAIIENAGGDVIEDLENLKTKIRKAPGKHTYDAISRKIVSVEEVNIYDPLRVKKNAISTATETANNIVRIDDIIAASEKEKPKKPPGGPGGMPGGPGGMPGGMPGGLGGGGVSGL